MYGAIIGDIAGSIYEYDEFNNSERGLINLEKRLEILSKKDLIEDNCFFSDDTILTIAILDSILNGISYADKLKEYGLKYGTEKLNKPNYFEYMFSNNFTQWCKGEEAGNSVGNGCMMRIAPIGFLYNSLEEIEENSELATKPSHNNAIAIRASKAVSSVIYLARTGSSKSEIIEFLKDRYDINLDHNLEELRKTYLFDATCNVLEICLYIVLSSNDYEAAIRNAISIGGDTDTIACIVGGMAEALYGVPKHLIEIAKNKLPIEFNELLENGYKRCNMQNFNYHTHTYRCGHTQKDVTDEDFVNEFIKKGFKKDRIYRALSTKTKDR